ncbi:MAG: DUF3488 and transglutaminase-like domain-containing protein [Candidatus Thiodiazotropha sp. (ex Epidulcina cf. delphinae)]|nr:DUF3488 and transglutaminase-like domain-containing protein [Candidatus Thiodiazotropha sp. (ex Epidulcina cf. delphinae)]
MKFDSLKVIYWYSLVSGIAASALLFAHFGCMVALLGLALVIPASYLILIAVRRTDEATSPYLKHSEQIALIGVVAFFPLMLLFNLLAALLVVIGLAQLALLFQTHDYRRFYIGLAIGFTALIAGAVESKSGLYLLFFLAYAVTISIALGYAHIEPLSRNRSQWNPRDQARAALWLIGAALIIYLILPRFPAGNLGARPGSDHFYENRSWEEDAQQIADQGDEQDPAESLLNDLAKGIGLEDAARQLGERSRNTPSRQSDYRYRGFDYEMDIDNPDDQGDRFSNDIVARMRADRPLYLRARIFDRFDGIRWHSSAQTLSKLKMARGGIELRTKPLPPNAVLERYEIFVERDLGNYVAAAAVPIEVNFPATVIGVDAFGQLHSPGALRKGTGYAVASLRTIHQGRTFAETSYADLPNFKQLPTDLDPRIAALAAQVTNNHPTQLAKAVALEQHLRHQYDYDFGSIFNSQQQTPLSRFLFETKKGHCEYFASALAIMLRTQGIPSRLVTGFSATNQNPLTGYYDIYALDGHAWVEAYVDDLGWLELEPTAYYDGPAIDNQTLSAEQINDYVERQLRLQQVLGDEAITLERLISGLWQAAYLGVVWLGAYLKLLVINAWPWLIGLGLALLSGRMLWPWIHPRWRAYQINQRLKSASPATPEQAIACYLEAIDGLLRNAGYHRPPGLTIEQFLARLVAMDISLESDRLSRLFNRIHYARKKRNPDPKAYRQLFETLYALGHPDLKHRLASLEDLP